MPDSGWADRGYPRSMSRSEQLISARHELETLRAELLARNEELDVTNDDPLAYDGNFADSAQVAAELGENQAQITANLDQLADIDAALAKLDAGTYGICDHCGGPIGDARLEAMPAARFCIDHA